MAYIFIVLEMSTSETGNKMYWLKEFISSRMGRASKGL